MGAISFRELLIVIAIYLLITLLTLIKIFRTEKDLSLFAWMGFTLFIPIVGPALYWLYYLVNGPKTSVN